MNHIRVSARLDLQLDQQPEVCSPDDWSIPDCRVQLYFRIITISKHLLEPGLQPKNVWLHFNLVFEMPHESSFKKLS